MLYLRLTEVQEVHRWLELQTLVLEVAQFLEHHSLEQLGHL